MLMLDSDGKVIDRFEPVSLSKMDQTEKWIQDVLLNNIQLLRSVHPLFEQMPLVPLCSEFRLPGVTGQQRLDILAVTKHGQLVLIECKLWKNPEARRKVIAQVLEYASLTKGLSYSDFAALLKAQIQCGDVDPVAYRFQQCSVEFDEPRLLDKIAASLQTGNFHLVIVGDGVRSGVRRITENLDFSAIVADLTLVELPVFQNSKGQMLLAPQIPFRTETVRKTVLVDASGDVLLAHDEDHDEANGQRPIDEKRRLEREFWEKVCEQTKFDHPDQENLKYKYPNHAWAKLPPPCAWLNVYRLGRREIGVQVVVNGDDRNDFQALLDDNLESIRQVVGAETQSYLQTRKSGVHISTIFDLKDRSTEPRQVQWLAEKTNLMCNAIRPLIAQYCL